MRLSLGLLLCLALSAAVAQLEHDPESLEAHSDSPFASESELEHVAEERDLIAEGQPEEVPLEDLPEEHGEDLEDRDMQDESEPHEQIEQEYEEERDLEAEAEPMAEEQNDENHAGDAEEELEGEHPFSGEDEDDTSSLLQITETVPLAASDPRVTRAQRALHNAQEKKRSILSKIKQLNVQLDKQNTEWKKAFDRARYLKGQAGAAENIKKNLAFRVTQIANRAEVRKRRRFAAETRLRDTQAKLQSSYRNLLEAERRVVRKSYQLSKAKRDLQRALASSRSKSM
jgi:hypothetical protein